MQKSDKYRDGHELCAVDNGFGNDDVLCTFWNWVAFLHNVVVKSLLVVWCLVISNTNNVIAQLLVYTISYNYQCERRRRPRSLISTK